MDDAAQASSARGGWWQSFTGLMPMAVTIPLLIAKLWAAGIVVSLAGGACVIAYHLRLGQGVATLDLVTIGFGLLNAVMYFGFGNTWLLEKLDVFVYTLLTLQVIGSLFLGEPWTMQYAKRVTDPAVWTMPQFITINRVTMLLWAAAFAGADIAALTLGGLARTLVPAALLAATAVATPRLARVFRDRLLPSSGSPSSKPE